MESAKLAEVHSSQNVNIKPLYEASSSIKTSILRGFTTVFIILLCVNPLFSYEIDAKVIKIIDGDSILVNNKNKKIEIRLKDIDAPEIKQAYGQKSKQNLSKYILNKKVSIKYSKKDHYGRVLGTVFYKGEDINLLQVKDGYAWFYEKYSNKKEYKIAMKLAKKIKKGLWSAKKPLPPWEYGKRYKR